MTNKEKFLALVSEEETKTVERAKERLRRKSLEDLRSRSLEELRAHELYRALISTSKIYNDNMELLTQAIGDEDLVKRCQERLELISEVFAELVGLERNRYGETE